MDDRIKARLESIDVARGLVTLRIEIGSAERMHAVARALLVDPDRILITPPQPPQPSDTKGQESR